MFTDRDLPCARCTGARLYPAPKETLSHIFIDCPMIINILHELNKIISKSELRTVDLMNSIWLGVSEKYEYSVFKTSLIVLLNNFNIFKTRKTRGCSHAQINIKPFLRKHFQEYSATSTMTKKIILELINSIFIRFKMSVKVAFMTTDHRIINITATSEYT